MSEQNNPDPNDEGEDTTQQNRRPTKLTLKAGKISVEAESSEESLSEIAEICSQQVQNLCEYNLRGEMQMLEKEDLHSIFIGG
ncbi:MAG: hypothetical protein ABEI77_00050, partial [Halorientalis sp.]